MVCHSYYEEDTRIRREAESLVSAGCAVDIIALRKPGTLVREEIAGVTVHRLPGEHVQGRGLLGYAGEYVDFALRAAMAAARLHRTRRYVVAQVHTLPDFLIFALVPLRLAGVPLILDMHEAMPAFFRSRFPRARRMGAVRMLEIVERASIAVATAVITVNDSLRSRLIGLGIAPEKIHVVVNSPTSALFDRGMQPVRPFMADGTLRLVYAGSLTPLYELGVVLESVAELRRASPDGASLDAHFDVYGRGDSEDELRAQANRLDLGPAVTFHGRVPVEEVATAIAASDIGIAPTRLDEYTAMSMSTKALEYVALGRLAVASRLPTVEHYFGADGLAYYQPGDVGSLASTVRRLVADAAYRERVQRESAERLLGFAWPTQAAEYLRLVKSLASRS